MRHKQQGRKLNRNAAHRQAAGRNLVASLFNQFGKENREYIVTTVAKAKEYRRLAERLITMAREATRDGTKPERRLALRRRALSLLPQPPAVKKLFDEIAPRYAERAGGYTRIVKTSSNRLGDGSQKVLFAFVAGLKTGGPGGAAAPAAAEAGKKPAVK